MIYHVNLFVNFHHNYHHYDLQCVPNIWAKGAYEVNSSLYTTMMLSGQICWAYALRKFVEPIMDGGRCVQNTLLNFF
jgi:hypothetical protein